MDNVTGFFEKKVEQKQQEQKSVDAMQNGVKKQVESKQEEAKA